MATKRLQANQPQPMDFNAMLMDVAQNKDRDSFVALFDYFAPRVKSFLMRGGTQEDTADELAQETMLAVWDKAPAFDPRKASASTWIFTIARNKKIDHLRRHASAAFESAEDTMLESHAPSPGEEAQTHQETQIIEDALNDLPPQQAALLRKAFFEDKSHGEIAAETGMPLGTIKSRIRLALDRLRKNKKVSELW